MEHFVVGTRALAVCEYVKSVGFSPKQVLDLAGIETAECGSLPALIPAASFFDLFHAAALVTGLPDFGLRWGKRTDFRKMGPLATYMQNCASIREAAQQGSSFITARNWGISSRVVGMGRLSRCDIHVSARGKFAASQFIESAVVTIIPIARAMLGADWRPAEVWFVHQPIASGDAYEAALGCPVRFGMLSNAIVAETADFDRRQTAADERVKTLVGTLIRECELHDEWSYVGNCKVQLRDLLVSRLVTINHLAARMRVAPSTLQRRLDGVGLGFRDLVTQVRLEIVGEELSNGGITRASMQRLGFSHPNAMSHFLRQHGNDIESLAGGKSAG